MPASATLPDSTTRPTPSPDDALLSWRAASAVWLLPTVADVAGMYVRARASGAPTPFWRTVAHVVPVWGVWVPLTAAVFWLARRAPLWRAPPGTSDTGATRAVRVRSRVLSWRGVATHAGASLVAALVHAVTIAAAAGGAEMSRLAWAPRLTMTVEDWLPTSLLLYCMTLGGAIALDRVRDAREQERRAAVLEGQLAEAELAVLRAQLEPHFLFNALNTAVSLVRAGEPAAGVDVLTRLADVLRHLLDRVAQETRLADELQLLDSYLGIARARFGARLTVTLNVPPALGDAVVPGLALQPLVENALRHGVGRREGAGHVWVDAWVAARDAHVLYLRVRDDGPGLGAGTALQPDSRIVASATDDPRPAGTGVGLRNLRDRLQRLYGPTGAGLTLHDRDGGGAEATVWLPLRQSGIDGALAGRG